MTASQGAMTDLIAHIAHPPEVLAWSNAQHARLVEAVRVLDARRATGSIRSTCQRHRHVLAGLQPELHPKEAFLRL